MEDKFSQSYGAQKSSIGLVKIPIKQTGITSQRAALTDITSLSARNQSTAFLPISSQTARAHVYPKQDTRQSIPSSRVPRAYGLTSFSKPSRHEVPNSLARDKIDHSERRYQANPLKVNRVSSFQAPLSRIIQQGHRACRIPIATSTPYNQQQASTSIPRAITSLSICQDSPKVVHHEKANALTLKEQITHLSPYITSGSDKAELTELPQYDVPPPDSDIAQLWEEVKEKIAEMTQGLQGADLSDPSTTTDFLRDHGITNVCFDLPQDRSITDYLAVTSISGEPQFTCSLDVNVLLKFYKVRTSRLFETINTWGPLIPSPEANGSLKDTRRPEDLQVGGSGPGSVPPTLSHLSFKAVEKSSQQFEKRGFGLDVEMTLENIGENPHSAKFIPSSMISQKRTGAIYLHVLSARSSATTNILAEWLKDAEAELLTEFLILRANFTDANKIDLVSNLRHFGYLIEGYQMTIWEMKIEHASGMGKVDEKETLTSASNVRPVHSALPRPVVSGAANQKSSSSRVSQAARSGPILSERSSGAPNLSPSFSSAPQTRNLTGERAKRPKSRKGSRSDHVQRPNKLISDSLPHRLPCSCRRISILDLSNVTDIKKFYEINHVFMAWGQAKHGMDFMDNLYKLIKVEQESYDHWMMSMDVAKGFWKDIVVFGGTETDRS